MDRQTFAILCHLLRTIAGLLLAEIVDVEKMVVKFVHVLAHNVKNCVIQRKFVWSDETVSQHFNLVLLVVLRLHDELIKKQVPVTNNCTDQRLKCFEVNMAIKIVLRSKRLRGKLPLMYSASATQKRFCIRPGRLERIQSRLVDCKCQREYFNMKHSSVRNVIERAFGVLKGCWAILNGKLYYPLQVQCCTILACCLLHNLINREMTNCEDIVDVDEGDSAYVTTTL
ncbi:putative nuclease HARBI1 [Cucumis melo var. makuwa]|uniref:Nuclease HARBI1 n=1 Tax=Cucumis melo var. makuwa TaxID=1194695 RepID=A0A5A7TEH4_CUCMM|nr:putative nuclease HARBI1 [Cucumis melo var. makuwa]TYK05355.1 putative nuclease HARBI1 [Cucumis melo var. makuwa]